MLSPHSCLSECAFVIVVVIFVVVVVVVVVIVVVVVVVVFIGTGEEVLPKQSGLMKQKQIRSSCLSREAKMKLYKNLAASLSLP